MDRMLRFHGMRTGWNRPSNLYKSLNCSLFCLSNKWITVHEVFHWLLDTSVECFKHALVYTRSVVSFSNSGIRMGLCFVVLRLTQLGKSRRFGHCSLVDKGQLVLRTCNVRKHQRPNPHEESFATSARFR